MSNNERPGAENEDARSEASSGDWTFNDLSLKYEENLIEYMEIYRELTAANHLIELQREKIRELEKERFNYLRTRRREVLHQTFWPSNNTRPYPMPYPDPRTSNNSRPYPQPYPDPRTSNNSRPYPQPYYHPDASTSNSSGPSVQYRYVDLRPTMQPQAPQMQHLPFALSGHRTIVDGVPHVSHQPRRTSAASTSMTIKRENE